MLLSYNPIQTQRKLSILVLGCLIELCVFVAIKLSWSLWIIIPTPKLWLSLKMVASTLGLIQPASGFVQDIICQVESLLSWYWFVICWAALHSSKCWYANKDAVAGLTSFDSHIFSFLHLQMHQVVQLAQNNARIIPSIPHMPCPLQIVCYQN